MLPSVPLSGMRVAAAAGAKRCLGRRSQNSNIEYLKAPPTKARLQELLRAMDMGVRELLREKGTPYAELGLADARRSDEQLLAFMVQPPILMNRPVVVTPLGAKLCRPSEAVLDILPDPQRAAFSKEDGESVIDAQGQRAARAGPTRPARRRGRSCPVRLARWRGEWKNAQPRYALPCP